MKKEEIIKILKKHFIYEYLKNKDEIFLSDKTILLDEIDYIIDDIENEDNDFKEDLKQNLINAKKDLLKE
ncbi:hypothetical protein NG783_10420 [Aliarcobacter cryaerophilus]|uniref:hypothetical protein n=1 Tax=Aliarcobacter cryaerophilus TaxID=28198 RepID=UPI003DA3E475